MMTIKKVILIFACLISSFILFFYATEWIWPEFNGSYNLSNNIYMIEWDGGGKVHGIRGYRNQNGRMAGSVVTMRKNEKNLSGLLKGSYSLRSVIRRLPKLVK